MIAFQLSPGFPKQAFSLLLSLHFLVFGCLLFLQPALAFVWLLVAALINRQFRQQQVRIQQLQRNPQGEWKLLLAEDQWQKAQLAGSSLVWDKLIILNFVLSGEEEYSLLLDRTALTANDWRRLRVSLCLNKQCRETLHD